MTHDALPLPPHYDDANAGRHGYSPNQSALFDQAGEWRRAHDVPLAGADIFDFHLLVIDAQKDFCFPEGSLYVGGRSGHGAIDDNRRLAEFIYRHLASITNLTVTMDSHYAFQIFFPSFWIDGDERPLAAHTIITTEDVRSGRYRPNPAIAWWLGDGNYPWLVSQAIHYCQELERAGKYTLYLWPPHCLVGSDGHAVAGVIHEARLFHSFVRGAQSWVEIKGDNPLTENYSVMGPEVLSHHDGQPLARKNDRFLQTLLTADAVAIAGQAASHCVKSTIDDLLSEIITQDRRLAAKVYILADCMSAVAIPNGQGGYVADFTPQAEAALRRFADHGMHVVRSTDPIGSWPDIRLGNRPRSAR